MPRTDRVLPAPRPSDDRALSPCTGYTRAHWEHAADRLIAGARRHTSPGGARVDFSPGGSDTVDQLEGFARTFLLAAIRLAGAAGQLPGLAEHYRKAVRNGVAGAAGERWPDLADHSQQTVEAAAIALGLHLTRPWVWDALDGDAQGALLGWLGQERGLWCADNNHVLLGATIAAFTTAAAGGTHSDDVDAALDRIDDWYAGDGWYSDGEGRRFDHYNAWTFHFYPLLICGMLGTGMGARREVYRDRLAMFLDGYQHLFGADGSPLLQGRSLTYRWGVLAPFWLAHLEGVAAISPGRTRRLASGVLRHFLDRGADADGILSLGWHGPSADILQNYSAAGSPYWASKGFLGLLLPDAHPCWTSQEEPLALELHDVRHVLSGPQWLVDARRSDGIARVHNGGSDGHPQRDEPLYRRLAFTTATVPVTTGEIRDNDVDIPGARHRSLDAGTASADGIRTRRRLDADGRDVTVDYSMRLESGIEWRVARIRGAIGLPVRLTGYPLPEPEPEPESNRPGTGGQATDRLRCTGRTGLVSEIHWLGSNGGCEAALKVLHSDSPTALGDGAAVPAIDLAPLAANDVSVAWAVSIGAHRRDASDLRLIQIDGGDAGVRLTAEIAPAAAGATSARQLDIALRWAASAAWPGDEVNQGVFRPGQLTTD